MKKRTTILATVVILSAISAAAYLLHYARLPDYEVLSSSNFTSGGDYRDTDIDVAVYKHRYDNELYKAIEEHHNNLNGTPNMLTINLYKSDRQRMQGRKPYVTIRIDYDAGTYEIRGDY